MLLKLTFFKKNIFILIYEQEHKVYYTKFPFISFFFVCVCENVLIMIASQNIKKKFILFLCWSISDKWFELSPRAH